MANDITKLIKEEARKTREHVDKKNQETQDRFGVIAEDLHHGFDTVAEQLGTVSELVTGNMTAITKIQETLEGHGAKLDAIEGTLGVMQQDISFIKNELKQKVDRDEFAALEKRVGQLETRQKV